MSDDAEIRPVPTGEETAAIMAVLRLLRQSRPAAAAPSMSAWQRAARREALRIELPHEAGSWGRAE